MRKIILLVAALSLTLTAAIGQTSATYQRLDPNNLDTYIISTGIFNQDLRTNNTPGFMWPRGSNRFSIFTTGLTIGAYVNGNLRLASCSYKGEYTPGRCNLGIPYTDQDFKIYKVTKYDGPSNPDWANWYKMVPYGAPYVDVNYNGTYEQGIDTPGVRFAEQTIFVCMTDGFETTHNVNEGFSGGTLPLFSEMHLTAWGYTMEPYNNMQFLKIEVINKGANAWNSTMMGVVNDPDLGEPSDDYIGCDTALNLGYCYNSDNMDATGNPPSYGQNPPACGIVLLRGGTQNGSNLGMTSFVYFTNSSSSGITCEQDPSTPLEAYRFLSGMKKDGSYWYNAGTHQRSIKLYNGNPETGQGWTEFGYNGSPNIAVVKNCLGGDTVTTYISPPGDRRFILGTGASTLTVNPGDIQKIYLCQMVQRGTNNKNAVTRLKNLAGYAISFFNNNFIGIKNISTEIPSSSLLDQNYPNPFNPVTKIRFSVSQSNSASSEVILRVYDVTGRCVSTLVNETMRPGVYETSFDGNGLNSGVYFCRLTIGGFTETRKMLLVK